MYGCVMILSGMLFGMLFGMIGFKMGKKSESKRLKKRNVAEIVIPTEETQRLLDLGFQDLSEGDPKKRSMRSARPRRDRTPSSPWITLWVTQQCSPVNPRLPKNPCSLPS